LPGLAVSTDKEVRVEATQSRWVSVRLQIPYDAAPAGSHPIHFHIQSLEEGAKLVGDLSEKSVFIVPR
jgi:hypothetical protein